MTRSEEETTYWLSYSDMMAALLLTFVLIISFTMLQAKRLYEEKESELEQQHELLAEQQEKLDEQQMKEFRDKAAAFNIKPDKITIQEMNIH